VGSLNARPEELAMRRLPLLAFSAPCLLALAACSGGGGGGGERITGEDAGETTAEAAGEDVGLEQAEAVSDIQGNEINQDPTFDDPALP
jgi:hypothetical protein